MSGHCKLCYKNLSWVVEHRQTWVCPNTDCQHKKPVELETKPAHPTLLAPPRSHDRRATPLRMELGVDSPRFTSQFVVFLDDVKQLGCTVADVAEGFVIRHKRDSLGRLEIDYKALQTVKEKVFGRVRIEWRADV